jgi:hypothetical protein
MFSVVLRSLAEICRANPAQYAFAQGPMPDYRAYLIGSDDRIAGFEAADNQSI